MVNLSKLSKGLNLLFAVGIMSIGGLFIPLLGFAVICVNVCALFFMYNSHRNYAIALVATLLRIVLTVTAVMKAGTSLAIIAGVGAVVLSILEVGLICMTTGKILRDADLAIAPSGEQVLLVTLIARLSREVSAYRPAVEMLAMMSEVLMLVSTIMVMVFYFKASKAFATAVQEQKAKEAAALSDDLDSDYDDYDEDDTYDEDEGFDEA